MEEINKNYSKSIRFGRFCSVVNCQHLGIILTCILVSAVILFFFSGTTSPLYNLAYSDGLVYKYVALGIENGKLPYIDVFDNKGPFLYFINYIARSINKQYGLLGLQWLNLSFFLCLCHKLHRQLKGHFFFTWLLPILFTFIIRFFDDGNLTEEWSLILLTLPLFFILPLYIGNKKDLCLSESLAYGLCIGLLVLLRLNNAVPLLAIILWWLIKMILHKEYKSLSRFVCFAFIGFSFPVVVAAGWIYYKAGIHGLYEWQYATIVVNIYYYIDQIIQPCITPLWKILPVFYLQGILICVFLFLNSQPCQMRLLGPLIFTIVITYLSMGQSWYSHYKLITVPFLFISLCLISQSGHHAYLMVLMIVNIYLCKFVVNTELRHYKENSINTAFQQDFAQVLSHVPFAERNQLWNLNTTIYHYIDAAYSQKLFPYNQIDRPVKEMDKYPQPTFVYQQPLWVIVDENELDRDCFDAQVLKLKYKWKASTVVESRHIISVYNRR